MKRHRAASRSGFPVRDGGIVVALGGEAGYGAVEWALGEAARRGCVVRVVLAWTFDVLEVVRRAEAVQAKLSHRAPGVHVEMYRGEACEVWRWAARNAQLLVVRADQHGEACRVGSREVGCPVVAVSGRRGRLVAASLSFPNRVVGDGAAGDW